MTIVGVLWLLAAAPLSARANGDWLQADDWRRWLDAQEIGGRLGERRAPGESEADGPSDIGRRLTAGALSLVLPGAGQFYNEQRGKALVMAGVEVAIWGTFLGFHRHAGALADDYRAWAEIYAGAGGEHPDSYWQAVGRFLDSDAWYDARLRQARAFGEATPPPPTEAEAWQWRNQDYRVQYQRLRADANAAYDRRDKMLLFAILNRAVAVYDAVRNGGRPDAHHASAASATLLGLDLTLEVSPVLAQPGARAMLAWSF